MKGSLKFGIAVWSAAMDPDVYRAFYRDDWHAAQQGAVESACSDEDDLDRRWCRARAWREVA